MHGDVSNPAHAVLTKTDYELYEHRRPLFRTALKGDLISKVFLFIGFCFAGELAGALVRDNCKITSGFGLGIGSAVINGALDVIYNDKFRHVDEHLKRLLTRTAASKSLSLPNQ